MNIQIHVGVVVGIHIKICLVPVAYDPHVVPRCGGSYGHIDDDSIVRVGIEIKIDVGVVGIHVIPIGIGGIIQVYIFIGYIVDVLGSG